MYSSTVSKIDHGTSSANDNAPNVHPDKLMIKLVLIKSFVCFRLCQAAFPAGDFEIAVANQKLSSADSQCQI